MEASTVLLIISLCLLHSCSSLNQGNVHDPVVRLVLQSTSPSIEQSPDAANITISPEKFPLTEITEDTLTEKTTMQINNLSGINTNNSGNISQPNSTSELHLHIPDIEIDNSDKKKLAKRSLSYTPNTDTDIPKGGVDLQYARLREYYIHHDKKYLDELPNPRHDHTWGGHNWHGRADTITELGKMGHKPTKLPFYVKDVSYKYNEYYYWWWALLPE